MRHRTSLILAASLVVLPIASSRAQSTSTASASASASAKASARVGRASSWQSGKKMRVQKSTQASFRGRTSVELTLRKNGMVALQTDAKKRLSAAMRAQAAAEANLRTKALARASAEAKLATAVKNLDQAKATLEAKVKARGSAELELKSARADQAKLEAKAQGSISLSFSLDSSKKKKKAATRVKNADTKVKSAKAEEEKAKKNVETAQVAHDKVSSDTDKAKQAEEAAEKDVSECKEQTTEAKQDVATATEDVTEVSQELAEQPPPAATEEVVIEDPPATPSDNAFGYETPVWGCFEGNVMFIEKGSPKLPTDYSKYEVASRLYACEWDVPQRAFEVGFPGVTNQFEWFAIVYSGMFNVSQAGEYQFRINSDDGTKLYIDGKPVVMNDGQHPPTSASGSVTLAAGDHELVLEYFQGPRYLIALQVWVVPPGGTERIFSVR
jgi:ribosomal protein L17